MSSVLFPNKKYNIIYADPPWSYSDKRNKHSRLCGGALPYYNTMDLQTIKQLPVNEITSDNSILFLWATWPNIKMAFEVIDSWGFEYKTIGFLWIKINKKNKKPFFGIGYYTKSNTEPCLLAVRGKPNIVSKSISSVIISEREEHSKKPDQVRDKITQLMGNIPRIELFARKRYHGWDAWGDQLEPINNSIDIIRT